MQRIQCHTVPGKVPENYEVVLMNDRTLLSHAGRNPAATNGTVNMPVYRASTVVASSLAEYEGRHDKGLDEMCYGAMGTTTYYALAEAMTGLERGAGAVITSSGLSACTMAILPFVSAGDHVLVTDSVYGPTRRFCDTVLRRFGVETTYYAPGMGEDIERLFRPETRLVFAEAPGSLTFEMEDIPAVAEAARRHGCLTLMDNTWASPLFFRALEPGVDIAIQAATKYIGGHSDLVLGVITARTRELYVRLKECMIALGETASPDDCYLALRGLRSMAVRMRAQQESALKIARWLEGRPEVLRVLYPALESDPGHALWKRDFNGAGALFGVEVKESSGQAIADMVDNYRYFAIGASWGGFESLVTVSRPERSAFPWQGRGTLLRFSIGLEEPDDLIADLAEGFMRLNRA